MAAEPDSPLIAWPHRNAETSTATALLDAPPPYELPADLPERVAASYRAPWPVEGPVVAVIGATYWRPIEHFTAGSYDLLDSAPLDPPKLRGRAVIELSLQGLVLPGRAGAPRIRERGQVQRVVWEGSRWALGTHISPPPGRLTVELRRPSGWKPCPAPLSTAASVEPSELVAA